MDHYAETFRTWNKVASLYEEKFMQVELYNGTYDDFCRKLTREDAAILEIGCGPGNITRYLLNRQPRLRLLGIDIAPDMISLARKNNPEATFHVMDSRDIATLQGPFDGVVCGFILPYLEPEDAEKLVAAVYTLLGENGWLYLSFVDGATSQSGYRTGSSGDRMYFHYYPEREVLALLQRQGFAPAEVTRLDYPLAEGHENHSILIARKSAVVA